jgi:hypothetical protein
MAQGWGLGALINLDHYGHYLTWHFLSISVSNLTVIVLMVVTFVVALVAPFPGRRSRKRPQ